MAFNPTFSSDLLWRGEDQERSVTADLDTIEANIVTLQNGKANVDHSHNGYASTNHTHTEYATVNDLSTVQNQLDDKVDVVDGKGLSTNDFTTAEKNKLNGISAGAQVNSITGVKGASETNYRTGNVNLTAANIGAAAASHTHTVSNITGTLPISKGGTGATTVAGVLTALGDIGKAYIAHPSNVAVPTGTLKTVGSLSLPKGTYIIVANGQWGKDSGSTLTLSRLMAGSNTLCVNRNTMLAGGGDTLVGIAEFTATTAVTYEMYHNYSTSVDAIGLSLYAVKLR